ncbi:MAG: dTMP kinase [Gammaproteobacteria bacterium]
MLKLSGSLHKKPLFITIEGIEGAGKSTNAQLVVDHLKNLGLSVVHTREPGGTVVAEKIRKIFLDKTISESITNQAELLMMFAARSQHLENLIIPALRSGKTVVCERFTDASFAYQGGGRGIDMQSIVFLENFVQKDLRPDLVLLFDVDVTVGLERIKTRNSIDRIEQEKIEFFNRVKEVYLKLARETPEKYFIVDANKDLISIKQHIIEILNKNLHANKLFEQT